MTDIIERLNELGIDNFDWATVKDAMAEITRLTPFVGLFEKWHTKAAEQHAEIDRLVMLLTEKQDAVNEALAKIEQKSADLVTLAQRISERDDEIERLQTGWELATKAVDENTSLKAKIERALDHYDMRFELLITDADLAAGMASILRDKP